MLNLKQSYRMGLGRLTVYCGKITENVICPKKEAINYIRFMNKWDGGRITWNGKNVEFSVIKSWNK